MNFLFDVVDLGDKVADRVVDLVVGLDHALENLEVHLAHVRSVVIIGLDEVLLGDQGRVLLLQVSVLVIFRFVDTSRFSNLLTLLVTSCLFGVNFGFEVGQESILLFHSFGVLFQLLLLESQFFFCLHLAREQLVVVFALLPQLVTQVFRVLHQHFLVRDQLPNLCRLVPI